MTKWVKLYVWGGEELRFETGEENELGLPCYRWYTVPPIWERFGFQWDSKLLQYVIGYGSILSFTILLYLLGQILYSLGICTDEYQILIDYRNAFRPH